VLISEYFQEIESQIANCIYIVETSLVKDKRSLHIGIIEGELFFKNIGVRSSFLTKGVFL
jgi:hypothetical protein